MKIPTLRVTNPDVPKIITYQPGPGAPDCTFLLQIGNNGPILRYARLIDVPLSVRRFAQYAMETPFRPFHFRF